MTEKDRFPFPDQVEDRFHGNDRYRAGRIHPTPTIDRRDACPTVFGIGKRLSYGKHNTPTLILPPQGGGERRA